MWWQYVYWELVQGEKFFGQNKSLISVKTVKYMRLEIWWVGAQDRNPDRPGIPTSLVKIRPYQGWGLRCKVSHPDAICSSCHNAEAGKAESWQGEFQLFFFFFRRSCEFFCEGKKTNYFPWMLSINFGINKMASLLVKQGVKTFHWKQAIAVASCFC